MELWILLVVGALFLGAECLPATREKDLRDLEHEIEDYLVRELESKLNRHYERELEPLLNRKNSVQSDDSQLSELEKKLFTYEIRPGPGRTKMKGKKKQG